MRRLAAIVLVLTLLLTSVAAQCDLPTTKGRDFWVGYLWNNGEAGTVELSITAISDTTATMTVENPCTGWSITLNLTATSLSNMAHATINIPMAQGLNTQGSMVSNFGLHVTSNADIWLTAMNNRLASGDAASILPTSQLGTRYIVQDYPNTTTSESANLGGCEVAFLATEDSTVLSMTLPCNTQPATVAPGNTLNVTLQRGQTYLLVTPTPNEFSGMEVTSNGKPFAMFQGNRLTAVLNGNYTSGDHIYEQAVPAEALGTDYVVTASYGRTWGDMVRITAADETCIVTADGVPIDTLAPFTSCDYHLPGNTTRYIHTSAPAGATLVMASSTWNAQPGDVSSVTLTPMDAGVCNAMFRLKHTERCSTYYVAVAVGQTHVAAMTLDGSSIASQFSGSGAYRHALIPVSEGNHVLNCTGGTFTGYTYAIGNVESYALPLPRSFLEFTYDTVEVFDTVCQGQAVDTLGIYLVPNVTAHPGDTVIYRNRTVATVVTHYILHLTVMPVYRNEYTHNIAYGDTLWVGDSALTRAGTYNLTLTTAYGCDSIVVIHLRIEADTIHLYDTVCQGYPYAGYGFTLGDPQLSVVLERDTVDGGTPYHIMLHLTVTPSSRSDVYRNIILGDTLFFEDTTLTEAGDYRFLHTAASGCDSVVVLHLGYEAIGIAADNEGVCPGEEVIITASGTHTFQWTSSPPDPELASQQGQNPIVVHPTITTTYSLLDAAGNVVASVTVGTGAAPKPCVEVNRQELDFDDPILTYHDCSEGRHHTFWIFADGNQMSGERLRRQFHHPLPDSVSTTMKTCNQYNCCADTLITLPMKIRSVWFPNIFTPDADQNNLFQCFTSLDVAKFSLVVYNRWGLEMWNTEDVNQPWDGRRTNGTPCPQGAYVYRYWITSADGRFDGGTGTVTLLR